MHRCLVNRKVVRLLSTQSLMQKVVDQILVKIRLMVPVIWGGVIRTQRHILWITLMGIRIK